MVTPPPPEAPLGARRLAGSPANYWDLTWARIQNMQWTVTLLTPSQSAFKEPHCSVIGSVREVIAEKDGDHHFWLQLDDNPKSRLACEITPQQKLPLPVVGQHIRVYGIFRYDLQHQWPEVHPVDGWVPA